MITMDAILTLTHCTAVLLAAFFIFLGLRARADHGRRTLPPGPKALPFIGNLLDIPHSEEWLTWQEYIERYGDLVYLTALGSNFLLLGSHEAISDLLEKRAHFNDRPYTIMLNDLMGLDWVLSFTPYGNTWRRYRKLMHSQTHSGAAVNYRPIQLRGARRFVRDMLAAEKTRPADKLSDAAKAALPHMIRINFGLTSVHMIYGIDVRDPAMEEQYVGVPEAVLHALSESATPGRFLVDQIPLLKHVPYWLPGAGFQRFGRRTTVLNRRMRDEAMAFTREQIASDSVPFSMASQMLQSGGSEEETIKAVAGTMYLAASDTVVAAVTSYFLAAIIYPEVQQRAQEELNRVVGRDRLPEFSDKDQLPYIDGVMRECLRWMPVVPNGQAHSTTQDDEYRGYFIPKGTIILPFQWGLLHDAYMYHNPSEFSPERYLTRNADGTWNLREDVTDPRKFAFGFGRRSCPGKHIAEQALFATLTSLIHTIDVMRAKDQHGQEVVPEARMSSGLLCHALPFPYEIRERTDAEQLVEMCIAAVE